MMLKESPHMQVCMSCMYTSRCVHTHTGMYVHMQVCICTCRCVHTHAGMYMHMHVYMYTCMYGVYSPLQACTYSFRYVHIYTCIIYTRTRVYIICMYMHLITCQDGPGSALVHMKTCSTCSFARTICDKTPPQRATAVY
jgi:hypothetical protein